MTLLGSSSYVRRTRCFFHALFSALSYFDSWISALLCGSILGFYYGFLVCLARLFVSIEIKCRSAPSVSPLVYNLCYNLFNISIPFPSFNPIVLQIDLIYGCIAVERSTSSSEISLPVGLLLETWPSPLQT